MKLKDGMDSTASARQQPAFPVKAVDMALLRPLLYTYRRCPYAMRARMCLLLAGVAFDAHEIVLRDKPQAMLNVSPKGTVPVLVLPDGRVIEQSWEIVAWALTQANAPATAQNCWTRAKTPGNQELLRRNDGEFKFHLDRYKYPERFGATGAESIQSQKALHRAQAMEVLLQPLEARLTQHLFLGGDTPCATDFGIFPFLRQFAAVDPAWFAERPLPKLKAWLDYWVNHPLFLACMAKLPSNQPVLMSMEAS